MDIDNISNNVDKVDTLLTKFGKLLKKHWLILILLLVGYLVYYFAQIIDKEIKEPEKTELPASNDSVDSTNLEN